MHRAPRVLTSVITLTTTAALGLVLSAAPASARSDLAGLWSFDEGWGQVTYDHSFSGNSGFLGSTPGIDAADPAWARVPGFLLLRKTVLRFSGSQRVTIPSSPSLEPDGVTLQVRVRSTTGGLFRYIASKGSLACESASYGLYTGAQGGARFYVSDGSSFTLSADAGPQIWDGAWHTIVGSYDGGAVRLWVDGRQVGAPVPSSTTIRYGLPDGEDLLIGDYAGSCGSPLGFVGDVDGAAVTGHYSAASLF